MRTGSARRRERGFTYLGVLFLLVLIGLGLAGTGDAWWLAGRRARERELLWTGTQYARAIKSYYDQSPGLKVYPSRLEDLLEDRRFPEPRHHLRQMYSDPISREAFGIVLGPDGRIAGVRSTSDDAPLKSENFPVKWRDFKGSTQYRDWLFTAEALAGRSQAKAGGDAAAGGAASGSAGASSSGSAATGTASAGTAAPPGAATPAPAAPVAVRPGPTITYTPAGTQVAPVTPAPQN